MKLIVQNKDSSLPKWSNVIFRIYKDTMTTTEDQLSRITYGQFTFPLYYWYYKNSFEEGQKNNAYDQYAIAYALRKPVTIRSVQATNLTNINYWSLNFTDDNSVSTTNYYVSGKSPSPLFPTTYKNNSVQVPDPFADGSPTTSCYTLQLQRRQCRQLRTESVYFIDLNYIVENVGNIVSVYRPDKESSDLIGKYGDDYVPGTCLTTYLIAPVYSTQFSQFPDYNYGQIKITLGNIYTTNGCQTQQEFDAQYFSVSSTQDPNITFDEYLPFWTVNARMLRSIANDAGEAYVFWAPFDVVKERKQNPRPTDTVTAAYEPPLIVGTNGEKGYLLQKSTYMYIFRYRDANPAWQGAPSNAPCYDYTSENKPITTELGPYVPLLEGSDTNIYF